MTATADRAALENVERLLANSDYVAKLGTQEVRRMLSAMRAALSLPDAAQARREAIDLIDNMGTTLARDADCEPSGQAHDELLFGARMLREASTRLRALAAQPAARGEKEQVEGAVTADGTTRTLSTKAGDGCADHRQSAENAPAASLRPGLLRAAEMARECAESPYTVVAVKMGDLAAALTAEAAKHAETPETKMDDAAVLERAAEIIDSRISSTRGGFEVQFLRREAERLRQPPAPKPEPDVDVFEKAAMEFVGARGSTGVRAELAHRMREYFGPLVEAMRWYAGEGPNGSPRPSPMEVLAQLRARAKEASRG